MGVWDTSVGGQLVVGWLASPKVEDPLVVLKPNKARFLPPPSNQQRVYRYKNWMVGKRVSFPSWSPKSLFCRGKLAAVCFRETYDMTDLDVSTLSFLDPSHFFFAKTDFRTELVRG